MLAVVLQAAAQAGEMMLSQLGARSSSAWASYCHHLRRRPLLTKAATGVVGSILGDGIAQYTAARGRSSSGVVGTQQPAYDVGRVSRLCTYAALIGSPIGHYWFNFLDKFIFPSAMGHPVTALTKTLLDQLLMAPAGIAVFFTAMGVLEGASPAQAWATAKEKFRPTLMANYLLWPAANLVNFLWVPPAQRILYCNVIYVFWASFLSTMAATKGSSSSSSSSGVEHQLSVADLAQKEL